MELTFARLDVAVIEARHQQKNFGDVITRDKPADVWYVPFQPLNFKDDPDWRIYRKESNIFVPAFPYLVPNRPTDALGFAFQLGVRAIHDLGGKPVRRLHLIVGDPVHQIQDPNNPGGVQWRFYMGFGVVLQ